MSACAIVSAQMNDEKKEGPLLSDMIKLKESKNNEGTEMKYRRKMVKLM